MLDEEYPSGIYTWRAVARRSGAELLTVSREPGQAWADAVLAVLDERVAIVSVPNVHWTDGAFVDLAAIAARSRALGARLVIDGSQSVGALPLDVGRRCDPISSSPSATSGCWGRSASATSTWRTSTGDGEPLEQNWILRAGSEDFARLVDYRDEYQPGARRFDVGQRTKFELTPMAIAALEQVLDWQVPRIAAALATRTAEIARRATAPRPGAGGRRRARAAHARRAGSRVRARSRLAGARSRALLRADSRRLVADRAASAHDRRGRRAARPGSRAGDGRSSTVSVEAVGADLTRAVRTVIDRCLAVEPGERVLVIADPDTVDVGRALLDAVTADAALVIAPPDPARGTEPSALVAAALSACDVFIAPCMPSMSHTTARNAASERGARGATMPGVTLDMLARLMGGDVEATARRSRAVAELLTQARHAHITCPLGTDLHVELGARTGIADDGDLRARGAFGNLPCGEAFIAPTGGAGRVVVSSIATFGLPDEPVELLVHDGRLSGARGAAGRLLEQALSAHGERGRNLAELGIGTNDRATLTGNVLEDEKLLGTIHSRSARAPRSAARSRCRFTSMSVVLSPTLTLDATTVVDGGRFVL